jgi:hypothetical protein
MRTKRLLILLAVLVGLMGVVFVAQAQAEDCPLAGMALDTEALDDSLAVLDANDIPPAFLSDIALDGTVDFAAYGLNLAAYTQFLTNNEDVLNDLFGGSVGVDVLEQALEVFGRYGLGEADIGPLGAVQGDPVALFNALRARGLDAAQIDSFLNDIAPVVAAAQEQNLLPYVLTYGTTYSLFFGLGSLEVNLGEISPFINDPAALASYFESQGIDPVLYEPVVAEVGLYIERGLSDTLIARLQMEQASSGLDRMGLDSVLIDDLASYAGGDANLLGDCLAQAGLSEDQIDLAVTWLGGSLLGDGSLDEAEIESALSEELLALLEYAELDEDSLAALVTLDDDELLAYLQEAGLDADWAEAVLDFRASSLFAEVVDPDETDAFVETALDYDGEVEDIFTRMEDEALIIESLGEASLDEVEDLVAASDDPDSMNALLDDYGIDGTDDATTTDADGSTGEGDTEEDSVDEGGSADDTSTDAGSTAEGDAEEGESEDGSSGG